MRFWDSSAVVPLVVHQAGSDEAESWLAEDGEVVTWTLTPVEVVSALRRLVREGALDEVAADALQLAAALAWAGGGPAGHVVHTLDRRLGLAAQREGFRVEPDPAA